jgi:signal transduction histidine kinase
MSLAGSGQLDVSASPVEGATPESRMVLLQLRSRERDEPSLGAGLEPVLDSLRKLLRSDLAALAFYDESRREVRWQVTSGTVSPAPTTVRLRPGQGFPGRIILTDLPLKSFRFPEDLAGSPASYPIFLTEGLKAAIGVPVRGNGRVLGVLMVASRRERGYSDQDLQTLDKMANSLSLATELITLHEEAIRSERTKLAQEVHDGLSQNLFGLKLLLYDAQQCTGSPEAVQNRLSETYRLLDRTLAEVRRLIADLRGRVQPQSGLVGALSDCLADFYPESNLQVELAVRLAPGEDVNCPDVHEALRIVQEALANIHRHAEATHVWVEVARDEEHYRLMIADDGKGFDPASPPGEGHFGLTIMRERAARLKGDLQVQSEPGKGTAITLRIPV